MRAMLGKQDFNTPKAGTFMQLEHNGSSTQAFSIFQHHIIQGEMGAQTSKLLNLLVNYLFIYLFITLERFFCCSH